MINPRYKLYPTNATRCPGCHNYTSLLCHTTNQTKYAQFYICWNCKRIFEAGRGELIQEGEVK